MQLQCAPHPHAPRIIPGPPMWHGAHAHAHARAGVAAFVLMNLFSCRRSAVHVEDYSTLIGAR